jgi:hypothetical protein
MTPTSSLPANGWEAGEQQTSAETVSLQSHGTTLSSAVIEPQGAPDWKGAIMPSD